jgi:hypothetical protein
MTDNRIAIATRERSPPVADNQRQRVILSARTPCPEPLARAPLTYTLLR